MAMLGNRKGRFLPGSLIVTLVLSTTPILDGCSRSEPEAPSATAPSTAPSVAAVPPAAQAPPPSAAPSPMAAQPPPPNPAAEQPGPAPGGATAAQLQELVAPIALYPDLLIAQILAASTYPTQVVEAARFMKGNPNLTGDALAAMVNPQPWDPSVKSLCQFPSVLQTMSDSLSWTSALGEAYYNQPADVMAAIQVMRKRAMDAGSLKSTPQQKVEVQSAPPQAPAAAGAAGPMAESGQPQPTQQVIVIQPAQPNTVYVPAYNPTTVYGAPVASPPGYSGTEMLAAGVVGFGAGMLLGSLVNSGNNSWGTNWYGGNVVYNRNVWVSNSNFVAGRYGYGAAGYRPGYPGYRPGYPGYGAGAGYRPGYPGARPGYPGYGGGRPGYPSTLPANRPNFAANNPNIKAPNFPKPSTLPNRPGVTNRPGGSNLPSNRPGTGVGANRPGGGNLGANRPGGNPGANRPGNNLGGKGPGGNLGANRSSGNLGGGNLGGGNRPGGNLGGSNFASNKPPKPTTRPASNPMRGYGGGGGNPGGRNGAFGGYQPGGFAQASGNRGRASFGGGGGRGGGFGGGGGGRRGGGGGGGGGGRRR